MKLKLREKKLIKHGKKQMKILIMVAKLNLRKAMNNETFESKGTFSKELDQKRYEATSVPQAPLHPVKKHKQTNMVFVDPLRTVKLQLP
ncbi:hypothetical protein TNCV_4853381 [Trichonephila clavipes]|nr:hypothetical protein TNCV_4853381 [Trichonephila clavipes]